MEANRHSGSSVNSSGSFSRSTGFFSADFGQRVDLCARLREILVNYPSGTTILKEFVQNAGDAGASTIRFCVDERHFPTESLAAAQLAEFQGPAMLVHNNAAFSDDDFDSIQRIGDSLKKEKLAQIGKFGIGFNSCYHLTEMPTFVSRSQLVMFDPQAKFIPDINPGNPGKRVDFLSEEVQEHFPDQLAPYRAFGLDFSEEFDGTLFRLPLRTPEQAETSRLSQQAHTTESLLELLHAFASDAESCLLFMKSISRIEALRWLPGQDKPEMLWSCTLENDSPELAQMRTAVPSAVTSAQHAAAETKQLDYVHTEADYELHISFKAFGTSARTTTHKWAVCATCQGSTERAGQLACDPSAFALRLVPWAGVATLFETSEQDLVAISGRPFCFLPLPSQTEMPVHVHGFFELSTNRRDIWRGDDVTGEGRIRVEWNKALLESVVAPTYARMLLRLTTLTSPDCLERYYALWPSQAVPEPWSMVVKQLYAAVADMPVLYSPSGQGQWVCPSKARYVPQDWKHWEQLQEVLLETGQPIVQLPATLRRTLAAFSLSLSDVSPGWTRALFAQLPEATALRRDRQRGVRLLEYCLSDLLEASLADSDAGRQFASLQGVPLAPMQDGSWQTFGKPQDEAKLLAGTKEEAEMLPALASQLVDCSLPASVVARLHSDAMAAHTNVEVLTASKVSELIGQNLPTGWYGTDEVIWSRGVNGHPTEAWMKLFWRYASGAGVGAFEGWPLLPTLESSLCKLSREESRVIDGAMVFEMRLGQLLHTLGCRVLHFQIVTDKVAAAPYVQQPTLRGVLAALRCANGGGLERVKALLEQAPADDKRELRAFLMQTQWMNAEHCSREDAAAVLALPIHEVHTSGKLRAVRTEQLPPAGAMADLFDEDFVRVRSGVELEPYRFLGVRQLSLSEWYVGAVFPRLPTMPMRKCEEAMLEMLRRLPQLCAEDAGFAERLRELEFVSTSRGGLFRPRELYDPNAPGMRDLPDDTQFYPSERFLQPDVVGTLVRLGLRTSLDREGVMRAAGAVEDGACEEMMILMVPTVQRTAVEVPVNPAITDPSLGHV